MSCVQDLQLDGPVILAAAILCLFLSLTVWTWRRPVGPGHELFRLAHIALLAWLAFSTLQLAAQTRACQVFWMSMTIPALTLCTMSWTLFLVEFGPIRTWETRGWRGPVMAASTIVALGIALTNPWHQALFADGTYLEQIQGRNAAVVERGPLYYLVGVHNHAWLTVATVVTLLGYKKARPAFRPLLIGLLSMTIVPIVTTTGHNVAGLTVFGIDPTPFALVVCLASYVWILINSRLLGVEVVGQRHIYRESDEPMLICDQTGKVASVNPFTQALLDGRDGHEAQAAIDRIIEKLVSARRGTLQEHQTIGQKAYRPHARPVEDPVHPQRPNLGWTITLVDITQEEANARSLREAKDRAEAVSRLQADLVSVISHELRTPLTSISGTLDLLDAGALGELPEAAQKGVSVARRNSRRLRNLIDDLLDLQKLEAGGFEMNFEMIQIDPILVAAIEELRGFGLHRGVQLDYLSQAEDLLVRTDVNRLKQVIANVVSNAVKFSPDGETVRISADRMEGWAEIRIEDRGMGIPAGAEEKVFGRFRQVDTPKTRAHEGTGLGMNISKLLMQELGGEIFYRSGPQEGTTFFLRVPIAVPWEQKAAV